MSFLKTQSQYLHYGCIINFSHQEEGYLQSSGFIDSSLYLVNQDFDFSECLFRVLPSSIHTVQNELLSSLPSFSASGNMKNTNSEALYKYQEKYSRLAENFEGEIETNLQSYEKLKGDNVRFGSSVYLQHVLSHKFLTVIPSETGAIERDALKVCLIDFPNDYSNIKFKPTYKFQKEGDGYIRINDIVLLEIDLSIFNKPGYVNTSIREFPKNSGFLKEDAKEINASLDKKFKWKINLYSYDDIEYIKILNYHDCFWISNLEGGVNLIGVYEESHSFLYFDNNFIDCNGVWKIENEKAMQGGYVNTEDLCRLKHMSSGMYLSIDYENDTQESYSGRLSSKDDNKTLWKFESIYSWNKNCDIEIDQYYCLTNFETNLKLQGIEDQEHMSNIRLEFSKNSNESSYCKLFKVDATSLWESRFTMSCLFVFKKFRKYCMTLNDINKDNLFLTIKSFKKISKSTENCLHQMEGFLLHKLRSSFSLGKSYGIVDRTRQRMFRELLVVDSLVDLLNLDLLKNLSINKEALIKNQDLKTGGISMIRPGLINIIKKIYNVLGIICQENPDNQEYAFKFFFIFQQYSGYDMGATACMTAILKNNINLLYSIQKGLINLQSANAASLLDHYVWLLRVNFK